MTATEDISKLELAAQILMAPPNQVSAQDRKEAETFLMTIRDGPYSIDFCRNVLEVTQNHFLMFELPRILVAKLLKEWSRFQLDEIRNVCSYLMNFCVLRQDLPNFVSTEMFHSAAMIVKRGSLKTDDFFSDILQILEKFLNSENQQLQAYGLQIIELISAEFSSTWRSSHISLTWDFHLKAKKQFEDVLLKRLMQLSLSILSKLINSSELTAPSEQRICDKFLRVSSLIFCWNFSPKYLYLHFKILISALRSNTFRPPESWHELFKDTSIVTFFMQLHTRVRYNETLCQNSMVCLTQLASLMGDALCPSGPIVLIVPRISEPGERRLATSMSGTELEDSFTNKNLLHDQYVQTFTRHLIEIFSNLVLDHEMASLTLVIYKLFTCHPIAIFERFPAHLLQSFITFILDLIVKLTEPAMSLAQQNNDQTYHEPLSNLFQVWRSILRSCHMFSDQLSKFITDENPRIIDVFIKSVLSPPFGNRTKALANEIIDENEEEEDDRVIFMDVLCDVGFFSLYSVDYFVDTISSVLIQRLVELRSLDLSASKTEQLQMWQEDFHWILLLTGYFMRQPSYSNIGNFPEELAIRCISGYNSGEYNRVPDFEQLFTSCIMDPPFNPSNWPGRLDPITIITTQILSWFSMEHQMLTKLDPDAPLLSPALCQTSLWQFSSLMVVLTPSTFPDESFPSSSRVEEDDETEKELARKYADLKLLPSISIKSPLSSLIIKMALEKMFAILTKMSGEKRLCADVIELLIIFAEHRAEELAANEHLYNLLSGLNIENLPTRRELVKSLVLIGSTVESDEVKQKMHYTILEPLRNRFFTLCQSGGSVTNSQLADYFECFTGVADAGQADTALGLFSFLQPVYENCVPLILKWAESQSLIFAILEFIKSSTDVLFFYVESQEETAAYHQLLINIINAYKSTQLQRFRTPLNATDEEQQTQDLSMLIEILSLSISKTYVPILDGGNHAINSARVSLLGLEILLPLMSEELLKVPPLCSSFFRLLIFVSDIATGAIVQVSVSMLADFIRCVEMALDNSFGIERVRSALEIVTNLSLYCVNELQRGQSPNPLLAESVLALIPKVFELSMQYSCELEIFNEATSSLFTLISLNQDAFKAYVSRQLLAIPANQDVKPKLEKAFTSLIALPDDIQNSHRSFSASRKRQFQNKFQDFLIEVSGALCLS